MGVTRRTMVATLAADLDEIIERMSGHTYSTWERTPDGARCEAELGALYDAFQDATDASVWASVEVRDNPRYPWLEADPDWQAQHARKSQVFTESYRRALLAPRVDAALDAYAAGVHRWADTVCAMAAAADALEVTPAQHDMHVKLWEAAQGARYADLIQSLIQAAYQLDAGNHAALSELADVLVGAGAKREPTRQALGLGAWEPARWRDSAKRLAEKVDSAISHRRNANAQQDPHMVQWDMADIVDQVYPWTHAGAVS